MTIFSVNFSTKKDLFCEYLGYKKSTAKTEISSVVSFEPAFE